MLGMVGGLEFSIAVRIRVSCCCTQFVSLRSLQNMLLDLSRVMTRVRSGLGFRPQICKLCMHNFEIALRILQIVHI